MYTAKVLNISATVNVFTEVGTAQFVPGETLVLNLRLHQADINTRYIPLITAITTFIFNLSDGTTLSLVGVPSADDRSFQIVTFTPAQSLLLLGGNIPFQIDMLGNGTDIKKGLVVNALQRIQEN